MTKGRKTLEANRSISQTSKDRMERERGGGKKGKKR